MKAIVLISGGLDSTLAAKLMQGLNIELIALNTISPFCLCNHRTAGGCFHGAHSVAGELGLELININVTDEFLEIVKKPRHGYGSQMNPCIDCRILLFKKAKELMQKQGASFVITGEVLGQRPMSQRLAAMHLIEKESGLEGLVLRPLSAKALSPTIPEKLSWVKRERLLNISGRSRRSQMDLAASFGIKDYPCPSGGCLLTDPEFCRRLKDLIGHQAFNLDEVQLLKIGRHFRLSKRVKLVVGRNESENTRLENLAKGDDYLFMPKDIAGPTALARGDLNAGLLAVSCGVTSRYCDLNGNITVDINYRKIAQQEDKVFTAVPIEEERLKELRI